MDIVMFGLRAIIIVAVFFVFFRVLLEDDFVPKHVKTR